MRKILFVTTLFVFIFSSPVWAADISGTWVLKYQGHSGDDRVLDMVIKADGGNLTVTTKHPDLGDMAGTGTLKGNDITITLASTGETKVGFELKGTVSGNKMAGTKETVMPEGDSGEGSGRSSGDRSSGASGQSSGDRPSSASGDSSGRSSGDRPSRASGDSSGSSSGGPPSGAQGDAGGEQPQATSNAWTAEKK